MVKQQGEVLLWDEDNKKEEFDIEQLNSIEEDIERERVTGDSIQFDSEVLQVEEHKIIHRDECEVIKSIINRNML